MQIYTFPQRTPEWYAIRRGVLSASDAATIAANGTGLETLCLRKALEIATDRSEDSFTNSDIERGIELEHEARSLYELQTGNLVKEVGFIKQTEFVGCSPDGLVGEEGMTEFKCLNDINHFKRVLGYTISREHRYQCQMQMMIANRKWNDYTCYNRNFPLNSQLVIERVYRDEDMIEELNEGLIRGTELIRKYLKKFEDKTK